MEELQGNLLPPSVESPADAGREIEAGETLNVTESETTTVSAAPQDVRNPTTLGRIQDPIYEGLTVDAVDAVAVDERLLHLTAAAGFPYRLNGWLQAARGREPRRRFKCSRHGQCSENRKNLKTGCKVSFLVEYAFQENSVRGRVCTVKGQHNHSELDASQSRKVRIEQIYSSFGKERFNAFLTEMVDGNLPLQKVKEEAQERFDIKLNFDDIRALIGRTIASPRPFSVPPDRPKKGRFKCVDMEREEVARKQPIFNGLTFRAPSEDEVNGKISKFCHKRGFPCRLGLDSLSLSLCASAQESLTQSREFKCAVVEKECVFSFTVRYLLVEGGMEARVIRQCEEHNHGPLASCQKDPDSQFFELPKDDVERHEDNPIRSGVTLEAGSVKELDEAFVALTTKAGFPVRLNGFMDRSKDRDGSNGAEVVKRRFKCSRYGKRSVQDESQRKRKRNSIITGCKFTFAAGYKKNQGGEGWTGKVWFVSQKHNHEPLEDNEWAKVRKMKLLEDVDKEALFKLIHALKADNKKTKHIKQRVKEEFDLEISYHDLQNMVAGVKLEEGEKTSAVPVPEVLCARPLSLALPEPQHQEDEVRREDDADLLLQLPPTLG